jgi:hypothetical protein
MLRVSATNQQLNDAVWEAAQTTVRFDNAHNQFVALSAKQFFENVIFLLNYLCLLLVFLVLCCSGSMTKTFQGLLRLQSQHRPKTSSPSQKERRKLVGSHFKRIEIRPQDFDEDDDPTFKPEPIFEPLVCIDFSSFMLCINFTV